MKNEKTIRIYHPQTFTLIHLLSFILDGVNNNWKIVWIEGRGHLTGVSYIDLEKKINNSSGMFFTWRELLKLSLDLDDLWEIVIIGDKSKKKILEYDKSVPEEESRKSLDYYIELVDSSFWEINSSNTKTANDLIGNISNVEVV